MRKINTLSIFLLLIVIGCHNSIRSDMRESASKFKAISANGIKEMIQQDSIPIEIEIPQKFETLNIDETIKEMKYIPLETNESSIIGRIDKLVIHKDNIFILDNSFSHSIYIFNIKGKHIKTINKKGHGPEEYIGIDDFCFNGDNLVIYDGFGKKLLFFNDQGDYLYKKETGFRFRNLSVFPNGDYLIVTRNSQNDFLKEIDGYSLLIGKPDSIVKVKGFKNNQFLTKFEKTITNPIVEFGGNYLFSPLLSNTIYQINQDGSYFPKYNLKFKNGLPDNYDHIINVKNSDKYLKDYNCFMGTFVENDTYLFLRFNPPGSFYGYVIYNKNNSKIICYDATISPESLFLGFSTPKCTYLNYFVSSIEPSDVLKNKKRFLKIHGNSTNIINIIQTIKENDNPILILYTLK